MEDAVLFHGKREADKQAEHGMDDWAPTRRFRSSIRSCSIGRFMSQAT